MNFPDVVGMLVDEGRQIIFNHTKDKALIIHECHSFKDCKLYPLSQARILKQETNEIEVHLYVGFVESPTEVWATD